MEINYNNINSYSYNNSFFSLNINEKLSKKVKEIKLPNSFGIYIIYKNQKSYENIIYIGKAGEIKNDGSFKNQGLLKRLKNVRNNKTANNYFKELFCDDIDKIIVNSSLKNFILNTIPFYIRTMQSIRNESVHGDCITLKECYYLRKDVIGIGQCGILNDLILHKKKLI